MARLVNLMLRTQFLQSPQRFVEGGVFLAAPCADIGVVCPTHFILYPLTFYLSISQLFQSPQGFIQCGVFLAVGEANLLRSGSRIAVEAAAGDNAHANFP